jgi:YihY family inner membrane protein
MNWIEGVIRRIDGAQRGHKASAFAFGVIKKYGDDDGGRLVADLAHSAFISLFPLFLVLVTVLGLIASGDPPLRHHALDAVAKQLPVIGRELERNVPELRRSSVIGLIIGLIGLAWGTTGLAENAQHAMALVWNLPGPARPGYFPRLGRSVIFIGVLGLGVCVATLLTGLSAYGHAAPVIVVLLELLAAVANVAMYLLSFRVLTPRAVPSRQLVPGAISGGIAWTVLQLLGGYFAHRYVNGNSVYGVFATALGLLAWISLSLQVTVYSAEINVVLARRLWPRTIVQPPLTEADRAVLAAQALQNQRRDDEHVEVSFDDRPSSADAASQTPHPGQIAGRRPQGERHP